MTATRPGPGERAVKVCEWAAHVAAREINNSKRRIEMNDFGAWAILELMGHVKLAGYITEEELFGSKIGRIDIPGENGQTAVTQYFGGHTVYRLTPVTEDVARAFAIGHQPAPVTRWELKTVELPETAGPGYRDDYEDGEYDDDDDPDF
jgi:hypothetical protein